MPNPNSWTTKLTLLLASSLTVMSGATVAPSLPAMVQQEDLAGIAPADLEILARIGIAQPFLLTEVGNATQTNFEAFYNIPVSQSLRITPIVQVIS